MPPGHRRLYGIGQTHTLTSAKSEPSGRTCERVRRRLACSPSPGIDFLKPPVSPEPKHAYVGEPYQHTNKDARPIRKSLPIGLGNVAPFIVEKALVIPVEIGLFHVLRGVGCRVGDGLGGCADIEDRRNRGRWQTSYSIRQCTGSANRYMRSTRLLGGHMYGCRSAGARCNDGRSIRMEGSGCRCLGTSSVRLGRCYALGGS